MALSELAGSGTGLDLVEFDPEPLCWRSQPDVGGGRLHLRPDAYVVVDRGQRRQYWFVEVDLSTESRPTLRRKMAQYLVWAETGFEQQRLGGVFPRVLWHCPDSVRRQLLSDLAGKAPGPTGLHVTSGLLESPSKPKEVEDPP